MDKESFCICGHRKKQHMYPAETKWKDCECRVCGYENIFYVPNCRKFKLDNLKYLEDKYDRSTK